MNTFKTKSSERGVFSTYPKDLKAIESNGSSGEFYNGRANTLIDKLFVPMKVQSGTNYKTTKLPEIRGSAIFPKQGLTNVLGIKKIPDVIFEDIAGLKPGHIMVSRKLQVKPKREAKWHWLQRVGRRIYNTTIGYLDEHSGDEFREARTTKVLREAVKERLEDDNIDLSGLSTFVQEQISRAEITYKRLLRDSARDGMRRKLGFKSRKNPRQTMYVARMSKSGPFPNLIKGDDLTSFTICDRRFLKDNPRLKSNRQADVLLNEHWLNNNGYITPGGKYDTRTVTITSEHGKWYISIYMQRKVILDETQDRHDIIALDPGTNPFLTGYDGSKAIVFGKDFHTGILKIDKKIDKLVSKRKLELNLIKKSHGDRCELYWNRERMWDSKLGNLRYRRSNLITDLHWKCATFIAKNYKIVVLPKFETQKIVKDNKINALNRNVLSLNHYAFKLKLQHMLKVYSGIMIETNEAYTSKTFCLDGFINEKLGSKKKYTRNGITVDRDVNGAINILLKTLTYGQ